ncbi:MAG: nicotinate-nucleotide--dimethylbenzimidazole phosphoribosyltransferase [Planctomycetes bacterium]|nr:nicotinate-nucleotide--dimethylbenzimidazole phosphoribosyltransferase [Planctomycetota bacterium]
MTSNRLNLPGIPPIDAAAQDLARARQATLTKPPGSLGRLEELSAQLAGIQGTPHPSVARRAVIVMAADHGVAEEGVSAYPQEVTRQMVANFLHGGAAINVLARQAGARVTVINIGVRGPLPLAGDALEEHKPVTGFDRRIAAGTANMTREPAMSRGQAEASICVGLEAVGLETSQGLDVLATGDMGIANTTASAAIAAAITGRPVAEVTGRGTGVEGAAFARKVRTVELALEVNHPDPRDGIDVLSKVGGLEIGGLVGVILGAAAKRIPVVLDGFISGAAALIACALRPEARAYLIASHRSAEAGHRAVLEYLGLEPLLDLRLRLGEGTGAVLALQLLEAAVRTLREMATFAEANVTGGQT